MGEVPLARLWLLPDSTTCLLLKDRRAVNWELRVVRGADILRSEDFASPIVAMECAKQWRRDYDPALEPLKAS
jgi:hypothetical protein